MPLTDRNTSRLGRALVDGFTSDRIVMVLARVRRTRVVGEEDASVLRRANQLVSRIKKGDSICASIAAASIVAKVYRDRLMKKLSSKYPVYRFAKNKGYGTAYHMSAIAAYHFTDIHRVSFNLSYLIQ